MTSIRIERTLTQAEFDRFAVLSGDDNPIHVDQDFSARTRFGRTVAHGVFLYSILRGMVAQLAPAARQISQAVRFPAPTYAGEPMVFEARVESETEGRTRISMKVTRLSDGTVTCDGHTIVGETLPPAPAKPDGTPDNLLAVGKTASTTRSFSPADIAGYVDLGGALPRPGTVPEPLIGAMFSYLLGVELPGLGTNYLKQETEFHSTARIGEPLTATVEIIRTRPDKHLIDLSTKCLKADGSLLAEGRALVYVGDVQS